MRRLAALILPLVLLAAPRAAVAKATPSDQVIVQRVLEASFPGAPTAALAKCINKTLPAGSMTVMMLEVAGATSVDGEFDISMLANSEGFRSLLRRVFLCAPGFMVTQLSADLRDVAPLSKTQATCVATAYLKNSALNDTMLTALIRSITTPDDPSIDDAAVSDLAMELMAKSVRGCVPKSQQQRVLTALADDMAADTPIRE